MRTDCEIILSSLLFLFMFNTKGVLCTNFVRLLELENSLPSEQSVSDFQSSLVTCISVCHNNIQCRTLFYNTFSTRCRHYKHFDYKQLRKEENAICYARYFTDIAHGKPTQQSSIYDDGLKWTSSLVVDGSMLTSFNVGYIVCSATAFEDYFPWWYVDLLDAYRILTVKMLSRADNAGHRLMDVDVVVGLNISHFGMFCGNYFGPATEGELVTLQCEPHAVGRYVKVMRSRPNNVPTWDPFRYILSLCEFQIIVVEN